jgi:hypothetical protein
LSRKEIQREKHRVDEIDRHPIVDGRRWSSMVVFAIPVIARAI